MLAIKNLIVGLLSDSFLGADPKTLSTTVLSLYMSAAEHVMSGISLRMVNKWVKQ